MSAQKPRNPNIDFGFHATVPRVIRTEYKELTPMQRWLYVCLKDLCGDTGTCYRSLRALSEETHISTGMLSESIPVLQKAGLIHAEKKKRSQGGKEVWHITIVDIWALNAKKHPTKRSHSEQTQENTTENVHSVNNNVQYVNDTPSECSHNERECSLSETEVITVSNNSNEVITVEEDTAHVSDDNAPTQSSLSETTSESENTTSPSEQSTKQAVSYSQKDTSSSSADTSSSKEQAPKSSQEQGNKRTHSTTSAKKTTPPALTANEKALREQVQQWIDEKRTYKLHGSASVKQIFAERTAVEMFAHKLYLEEQGNHDEGCTWDELEYLWKMVRSKDPYWSKEENRSRVGGYALQQQFATVILGKYRPAKLKQIRNQNAAQNATQAGTNMVPVVAEHRQKSELERHNAEMRQRYGSKQIS